MEFYVHCTSEGQRSKHDDVIEEFERKNRYTPILKFLK